jgi:hypothetical protein
MQSLFLSYTNDIARVFHFGSRRSFGSVLVGNWRREDDENHSGELHVDRHMSCGWSYGQLDDGLVVRTDAGCAADSLISLFQYNDYHVDRLYFDACVDFCKVSFAGFIPSLAFTENVNDVFVYTDDDCEYYIDVIYCCSGGKSV